MSNTLHKHAHKDSLFPPTAGMPIPTATITTADSPLLCAGSASLLVSQCTKSFSCSTWIPESDHNKQRLFLLGGWRGGQVPLPPSPDWLSNNNYSYGTYLRSAFHAVT